MIYEGRIRPVKSSNGEHPLSWFQERLWVLNQKEPEDVSYNIPVSFLLEGQLDVSALRQSLNAILARHETLRARITTSPRGEPIQFVMPEVELDLPVVSADKDALLRHVTEVAQHVFDLSTGPLVIGRLLRMQPDKHVLLLNVHHIAADGWSVEGVLFSELRGFYAAFSAGKQPEFRPLPIQYSDFAAWQRSRDFSDELRYWQENLRGYEDSLELPTDFARKANSGRTSRSFVHRYDKEFSLELDRLAQEHGCTLFMCLLAGFALVVNRYTAKEDLCIGTTTFGRTLPELEGLIGFFVNILPLRIGVDEDATVSDYLRAVKQTTLEGFDHQMVPFERILYSLGRARADKANPLVPLVVRHQNFPRTTLDVALPGGLKFEAYGEQGDAQSALGERAHARCELELSYVGDREELTVEVVYASDLYRHQTVERFLAQHEQILRGMAADSKSRLRELSLLTPADTKRLCVEYDQGARDVGISETFVRRWDEQVRKTPDAVACHDRHSVWRYRELGVCVDRLVHVLLVRGVRAGDLVGVCLDRGAPLLVSLLAVWKLGAAYVPLDPAHPSSYLKQILENASPKLAILGTGVGEEELGLPSSSGLVLDPALESLTEHPQSPLSVDPAPEALAYVAYTSGSTGTPKGVRVPHRQLMNWLTGLERSWPFSPDDVVAQKTTITFVVAVKEMFSGLLNGRPVVFFDTPTVRDTAAFVSALRDHRVTRMNLVPSHLDAILTYLCEERRTLPELKLCIVAGEPLSAELVKRFREVLPGARLINNYGCTELNDIAYYDTAAFDGTQGFVPIGKPIQNTQVYILDRSGRLVPEGVGGELHVASVGMSEGYHALPAFTKERYLKNPFSRDPNSVLYNTGDVVKRLPDGNLEFLGRWDFQVKVRGFRVDVRQVEKVLSEYPGISAQAVVGQGERLVSYYVGRSEQSVQSSALRAFLEQRLPSYMVPTEFVALKAMPRLPNGKLDRRALAGAALRGHPSEAPEEQPATEMERVLSKMWSEVLEYPEEDIGRRTHFFEIGGQSLAATRLVARIKDQLGVELGLSVVFEHPRLEELAAFLSAREEARRGEAEAALELPYQLSRAESAQRRVPGLLEGKVVLITGGSRGIGSATARLLASQGASVAINYVNSRDHAQRAKEVIDQDGGVAEIFQGDVTDPVQVEYMVEAVRKRFHKIDVLVANAAIGFKIRPFLEYGWEDFEQKLNQELKSAFYLCQAVVPEMSSRREGSIVMVSSTMSKQPHEGYVAHASAKAALDAFVRALAIELGPNDVRINTVAPGLTLTDATAGMSPQVKDSAAARCPLRRNGMPRDVAGAVLFLASDLSRFMTGTYVPVDGGFTT